MGHHAASDALELGGAHAAPERPRPEAVGHAVHGERAHLRRKRLRVLRHIGLADDPTGRAVQVDLPTVSRHHGDSMAHRWLNYPLTNSVG